LLLVNYNGLVSVLQGENILFDYPDFSLFGRKTQSAEQTNKFAC